MQKLLRNIINIHLRKHELNDASSHEIEKTPNKRTNKTSNSKINVTINETTGEFEIHFGENQKLSKGSMKVYYKQQWYSTSNSNDNNSIKLILSKYQKKEYNSQFGPAIEHIFLWNLPSTSISIETSILQMKNEKIILFSTKFPQGLIDCSTGNKSEPCVQFPIFHNQTSLDRLITYKDLAFSPPTNKLIDYANAPVCLYDEQLNVILCSALNDFATNLITLGDNSPKSRMSYSNQQFVFGCSGMVNTIPENYKMEFIMDFGQGINKMFQHWGDCLHKWYNTPNRLVDPYENLMNSHIGYFTDAGSYYYYNPLPGTKFDETLIAIEQYYTTKEHIPFAYYHLDSWWYPKTKKPSAITSLFAKLSGGSSAGG